MKKNITTNFKYTKLQKNYANWLKLFFIGCLANSVVLFYNSTNEDYLEFSMMVPFIHLGIIWFFIITHTICYWIRQKIDEDSMYIKENYPSIWKKLHPVGDFSRDSFAGIQFLRGKYDDGTDEKLNQIKFSQIQNTKLILGTFFMVPVIWFCNILVVLIPKIMEKV